MHIFVTTPIGNFKTSDVPVNAAELQSMMDFLEQINDFKYIALDTDEGKVYLAKGIIQNSLFLLVTE